MFNARELKLGKFFDLSWRLGLGYWLEGARHDGWLRRQRLMRIAALGRIPAFMGIDLCLSEASQIVIDGVFGIEAEVLGVGANEPAIEDAAREMIELLLFDGLQHARADLGDIGNVVERELFVLACLAEFVSELAHVERPFTVLATS
jgi:hypothetical protein